MQPDDRSFAASLPALSVLSAPRHPGALRKIPAEEPRLSDRRRRPLHRILARPPQETEHAEARSLLAIQHRASNCSRPEQSCASHRAPNCYLTPTAPRPMAAAACRLSESDRGLDARSAGIGRRLLSREVHRLYGAARSGASRFAERQDTGRLRRFHRQFRPLSAKPGRMVRGTAHPARSLPTQCRACTLRSWRLTRTRVILFCSLEVALEKTFGGDAPSWARKRQVTPGRAFPLSRARVKTPMEQLYPKNFHGFSAPQDQHGL